MTKKMFYLYLCFLYKFLIIVAFNEINDLKKKSIGNVKMYLKIKIYIF